MDDARTGFLRKFEAFYYRNVYVDLCDFTGDNTPVALADLLADNAECPIDDSDVQRICSLNVGETTRLAICGGSVQVRRVAKP